LGKVALTTADPKFFHPHPNPPPLRGRRYGGLYRVGYFFDIVFNIFVLTKYLEIQTKFTLSTKFDLGNYC